MRIEIEDVEGYEFHFDDVGPYAVKGDHAQLRLDLGFEPEQVPLAVYKKLDQLLGRWDLKADDKPSVNGADSVEIYSRRKLIDELKQTGGAVFHNLRDQDGVDDRDGRGIELTFTKPDDGHSASAPKINPFKSSAEAARLAQLLSSKGSWISDADGYLHSMDRFSGSGGLVLTSQPEQTHELGDVSPFLGLSTPVDVFGEGIGSQPSDPSESSPAHADKPRLTSSDNPQGETHPLGSDGDAREALPEVASPMSGNPEGDTDAAEDLDPRELYTATDARRPVRSGSSLKFLIKKDRPRSREAVFDDSDSSHSDDSDPNFEDDEAANEDDDDGPEVLKIRPRPARAHQPASVLIETDTLSHDEAVRANRLKALFDDPRGHRRPLLVATSDMVERLKEVRKLAPAFIPLIDIYVRAAELSLLTGTSLQVMPVVVNGPPGCGKTYAVDKIAKALGTSVKRIDMNTQSDSGMLFGHEQSWRGSKQGLITRALCEAETANVLLFLDEIDKLQATGTHEDPYHTLLTLLEPENSRNAHDNYLCLDFNLSHALIICTANDLTHLSAPILDRLLIIEIGQPDEAQRLIVARTMLREAIAQFKTKVQPPSDDVVERLASHHPRRIPSRSDACSRFYGRRSAQLPRDRGCRCCGEADRIGKQSQPHGLYALISAGSRAMDALPCPSQKSHGWKSPDQAINSHERPVLSSVSAITTGVMQQPIIIWASSKCPAARTPAAKENKSKWLGSLERV